MPAPIRHIESDPSLPGEVDVVVIGGGVSGVFTAWELARRGSRVALVEKGVIAGEQSSRNWGWCRAQNRDRREVDLARVSLEAWGELASQTGADVGFRRTGLVFATDQPEDIARWEEWKADHAGSGIESHILTSDQVAALLPASPKRWLGGVHSPNDGSAEPGLAGPVVAHAARGFGATVHQNCAVREIEMSGGRVSGVVTEKGAVKCHSVVVACGAWTGLFLRHHGIGFLQASVQATAISTGPMPQGPIDVASMESIAYRRRLDGGYTIGSGGTWRLQMSPLGLLQAGAFWKTFLKYRKGMTVSLGKSFFRGPEALQRWSADSVSPFERVRILDPLPEKRIVKRAKTMFDAMFPQLAGVGIVHQWAGMMDFTPDAVPVIAPVIAHPGVFINSGHSGHGFGMSPGSGRLTADLVLNDAPCIDPRPFRYERMIDGTDLGAMGMM
ncbi:MAG: FAD-binding oxidoreductase [Rhizobiaceae bacterium]